MRISTRLMLAVLVPLTVTLIVGLALVYSYRTVEAARANGNTVRQIRSVITDLNHLVFSYVSYHEERPRQQFPVAYDSLNVLIAKIRLRDPEQQRLLEDIRLNSQSMQDLFVKLISIENPGAAGSDKALKEAEAGLAGQLLTRSRRVDSSAALLRELTDNDIGNAQHRAFALVLSVLILTTAPLTVLLTRTRKSITTSLAKLHNGTKVVGSGDLEHRLAMPPNDELGEVARSFDNMTEQLQAVTVSKGRLQQEVEERKKAEEELRQHREWLRVTLTSIGDAVIATDVGGKITFMNAVAEEATGWTLPDAYQKPVTGVFHIINEHTRREVESPVSRVLREGMVVGLANHTILVRKDGTEVPIDDSGAPIRGGDGKTMGVVLVFHDITDRKRAEEALQKAHDELEHRVQERTAELQKAYEALQAETEERKHLENQLSQAHKMQAIGTLAGGVAHDFNNILAAIIGFTEMVLDDVADNRDVQHKMEQVLKAGFRGRDLVKQILAFSRKTEGERKEITLTPLVKETHAMLRSSLPSTIQMPLVISTGDDHVLADPTQLQQVLMNLATNAAYAMREDGGQLTIGISSVSFPQNSILPDPDMEPGTYVKLTVKDTGSGMADEVRQRIFEPFFTTKEKGKGTGMGLAVVYGIVKAHGGAVSVQSEKGQGSTFEVFIPKVQKPEARKEETAASVLPTGTERILFVDDEELLVEMARDMLESLGYHVTVAANGTDAWNLFLGNPSRFDLVITDQTMPDVTGVTLAQKMLGVRKDTPIILCTGYSEMVSAEKAQEVGISAFVMKPVMRKELAETIRRVMDGKTG